MTGRARRKQVEQPFNYGFPPPAPVPRHGCEACASYMKAIKLRKRTGNESGAGDYRVLMARHIEAEHG